MAITLADFNKIWASSSPLTPYSFSDDNYNEGWNFIGVTPPSRQMWDFLQKNNDEKMKYLANNYLPLSGGTMTGDITASSTDWKIKCNTDDKSLNFWAGSHWSKGAYMSLYGIDHAQYPGWFRLYARNSTTSIELRGKPDGTLTWGGNNILTSSNYNSYALPLSGGTMTGNLTLSGTREIMNATNTDSTFLDGGKYVQGGSSVLLYGRDHSSRPGYFIISARKTDGTGVSIEGKPDGTLTWDGQPLLPVGIVQAFAGTTIPNGWLLCDGSAVSRTAYANLFACIGTTYGSGDGSTTFNLPNLTDRFIQGNGTSGTVKTAGLPNITGSFEIRPWGPDGDAINYSTGVYNSAGSSNSSNNMQSGDTNYSNQKISFDASRSSAIYGNSTTVQPPALTMQYIIKY